MEKELLQAILSELKDISLNSSGYDHYDNKVRELDNKLDKLVNLMKKQVELSETIIDRLDSLSG